MRFGIFQSAQWPEGTEQHVRLRDAVAQSVLADELGYDSVFMTEHHFSRHGIVPDNLSMLSFIAALTKQIRLGTAVSVLPLHDPIRLAESVALVDQLSNGRVEFGIGRGYQWGEFDGFGQSLADREARFDEAISVILQAWKSSEPFNHEGSYWEYRNIQPQPQAIQKPHPPIWMATASGDGFDLCAKNGWGVMLPQAVPIETVALWVTDYKTALDRYGKPFDPNKLILARGLHLGDDDATAWAEAGVAYENFLALAQRVAESPDGNASPMPFDLDSVRGSTMICGTETCIEKLQAIRALGIEYVIFFSNMGGLSHSLVMESLKRFATTVMLELR